MNVTTLYELIDDQSNLLLWPQFKLHYNYTATAIDHMNWLRLIEAIPKNWLKIIQENMYDIELERGLKCISIDAEVVEIEQLSSKMIYLYLNKNCFVQPTAKHKWNAEILYDMSDEDWSNIYNGIYRTSIDSYSRQFQYKIVHRYLPTNSLLYKWRLVDNSRCSYCFIYNESITHLFTECIYARNLYIKIQQWLQNVVDIPFHLNLYYLEKFQSLVKTGC